MPFVPDDPVARKGERPFRYLAILALNLYRAMSLLILPRDWRGERLGTVRFRLLNRGGRVIRHSRRYVLVLSQLAVPLLQIYLEARRSLAGLGLVVGATPPGGVSAPPAAPHGS